MNKKLLSALAAVLVVFAISAVVHFLGQSPNASDPSSASDIANFGQDTDSLENKLNEQAESPAADFHPEAEVKFSKQISFNTHQVLLDGSTKLEPACNSEETQEPKSFGFMNLDGKTKIPLICRLGYLGGIRAKIPGSGADTEPFLLSEKDGDAGDVWDLRSWIFKSDNGKTILKTVVLSSSEDLENQQIDDCRILITSYEWNAGAQKFDQIQDDKEFDLNLFTKPINVAAECLDQNGKWKGLTEKTK